MNEIQRSLGGTVLFIVLILIEIESTIQILQKIVSIRKWPLVETVVGIATLISVLTLTILLVFPIRFRVPRFLAAGVLLATMVIDTDYFVGKLIIKSYKGDVAATILIRGIASIALCTPISSKISEVTPFIERPVIEQPVIGRPVYE
jgi:hypothetical protein